MSEPAPLDPGPFPYYKGPNDAGELRKYLNELIRLLNELVFFLQKIIIPGLRRLIDVDADYSVMIGDGVIDVDASGGDVTITYDPALIPFPSLVQVTRINKVDMSSNFVNISNGTDIIDQIGTAASSSGQVGGWRDVFGNGTSLLSAGVG